MQFSRSRFVPEVQQRYISVEVVHMLTHCPLRNAALIFHYTIWNTFSDYRLVTNARRPIGQSLIFFNELGFPMDMPIQCPTKYTPTGYQIWPRLETTCANTSGVKWKNSTEILTQSTSPTKFDCDLRMRVPVRALTLWIWHWRHCIRGWTSWNQYTCFQLRWAVV